MQDIQYLRAMHPCLYAHSTRMPHARTFRLGTFLTLSGCFLTYFFLPLRECLAQTSLVWSLKRGGTALLPCVSPFGLRNYFFT